MRQFLYIINCVLLVISLTNCSGTKHLAKEEVLVKKTKIAFDNPKKINKKRQLKTALQVLAQPKTDYGWGRMNLWVYNAVGPLKKQKGLKHWLKHTIGRPPQLYQNKITNRSKLVLEKHLKDNGYFGSIVTIDTMVKKQQITITYRVHSRGQFMVNNLHFPNDTTAIGRLLNKYQKKTKIKVNHAYSKLALDEERLRLTQIAGRHGYMYFQENNIFYLVDTTKASQQAAIHVKIIQPIDSTIHEHYTVGETFVYPAYLLGDSSKQKTLDTIFERDLTIIQPLEVLKPNVLGRTISQSKGDLINRELQDVAVGHLLDMGLFKFVRLKHQKSKFDSLVLNRYFYLTPSLTQHVELEFQVNNRSGSYLGTAATAHYSHKNLFKGAERLDIRLTGGVETQSQNRQGQFNIFDLGIEATLLIPKMLVPFRINNYNLRFVPKTRISVEDNYQKRKEFYTINTTGLKFGYDWKQNAQIRHQFNILNLNQVDVSNKSTAFQEILDSNSRLENSFQNNFILGLTYTYIFNAKPKTELHPYTYFRTDISTSGNILSLFGQKNAAENTTKLIWGRPYAQFFRISPDFRYYIPTHKQVWASRILFGIGIPYGNSKELPYVEQFFVGGANSIRAFRFRGLGPGSFLEEDPTDSNLFFDQTGDIRLEMNLEYRFDIVKYLEGAFFVDAGNIWLLRSKSQPEGVFNFERFFKEIALGTGFGLRLNFEFFVIRLDAAFPLRQPVQNGQFGWTVKDISFLKQEWRNNQLVFNLAIGYPF